MENLYYNGNNIIDLAKRRKPQIHSVVSPGPPWIHPHPGGSTASRLVVLKGPLRRSC